MGKTEFLIFSEYLTATHDVPASLLLLELLLAGEDSHTNIGDHSLTQFQVTEILMH